MAQAASPAKALPAPKIDVSTAAAGKTETAVLSGGCFWGVQGVFEHVKGVKKVYSGYAGGPGAMAHYELVSTGTHRPRGIGEGHLRSGSRSATARSCGSSSRSPPTRPRSTCSSPTRGRSTAARSSTPTPDQKRVAEAYIQQLNDAHVFRKPIATRVDPLKGFFKAEDYHQDYLTLHPNQPYIATYDIPKVAVLREVFPDRYVAKPTLVFPTEQAKARPAKTAKAS